jgi:ATP dependent DNA ligase domain
MDESETGGPAFAIAPPVEPMLAKLADTLPEGGGFLYEPKWDGFRAIVFRHRSDLLIQSRDLRPLDRYFPELRESLLAHLPSDCVVDGEIVIPTPHGLDFDALQLRLHPAASRVAKLAKEIPASFVAFDALAIDGRDVRALPQHERRVLLERALAGATSPIHLTPMTRDRNRAADWLSRFEGAGLDGVIAKPEHGTYEPGKRAMIKVKHARTADCVVAGFRWHKNGRGSLVGSLLLGLYDERGRLNHVGVTSAFSMAVRRQLAQELEPLREHALDGHPWRDWAEAMADGTTRRKGSLVGSGPRRACLRGQVRPHAGRSLSTRGGFSPLAAGQTAGGLPLRPARSDDSVRTRESIWSITRQGWHLMLGLFTQRQSFPNPLHHRMQTLQIARTLARHARHSSSPQWCNSCEAFVHGKSSDRDESGRAGRARLRTVRAARTA